MAIPGGPKPSGPTSVQPPVGTPEGSKTDGVESDKAGLFGNKTVKTASPTLNVSTAPVETARPQKKSLLERMVAVRFVGTIVKKIVDWAIKHDFYRPKFAEKPMGGDELVKQLQDRSSESNPVRLDLQGLKLQHGGDASSVKADLFQSATAQQPLIVRNVDFSGADLSGLDLSNVQFQSCDFSHANLSGCKVSQSSDQYQWVGCSFDHANLESTSFSGAKIRNCDFSHASLKDSTLKDCHFKECGSDKKTSLEHVTISDSDMTGLPLAGVTMLSSHIANSKLESLQLSGSLNNSTLDNVSFTRYALPHEWAARGITFKNMDMAFNPAVDIYDPSSISFAKFSGCLFESCNVAMNNQHYLMNSCTFNDCPTLAMDPGFSTQVKYCRFNSCPDIQIQWGKLYEFSGNQFRDSSVKPEDIPQKRDFSNNAFLK
ncbi:pentapeptide repeat-containing protein [Parendozoicomonas haliclonae]|uniref:Secreted effector protein pipB2 n=1 Tax=Parendozoicomonas haliclonae TaxID=1960125 RepID=A0A1X7ALV1_9GAMM|nr:pentapeptide repeat-containing protein [Parendozoicomonas haliclonae]SMA48627.1 Secreted effector protein pipB2 [Parendozoicomonas haliclonae]